MAKAPWRIAESPETRRPLLDSLAHPQFGHAGHLHRPDAGRPPQRLLTDPGRAAP
ncbi:hypothetical protein [Streptomyces sp. ATCC 21386]|uniref:hypothetical protein n=1 Tax=Streptomyces sp. ATCC 21386 TaxID=2699428 RepID=UPI001BFFAE4E|nr:hypothetical protein [Streptomyces sp. ATCC 21386]